MRLRSLGLLVVLICLISGLGGCAAPPPRTGFISDYSSIESIDDTHARYVSPRLSDYQSYIVDPVEIREMNDPPVLTGSERAEVANYFRDSLTKVLREDGYQLTDRAGEKTARIRIAITQITKSTWWLNLYWATKLSGVGTGSAAMEAEVIDSVTGEQLAASVRSDKGSQFELFDTFDKLDDIKDVIDRWAKDAERRLLELRKAGASGRGGR